MSLFVPRPYTKEQVTIRIDVEKLEQIDAFTRDYHISRSEFINRCIDFAMEHMPRETSSSPHGKRNPLDGAEKASLTRSLFCLFGCHKRGYPLRRINDQTSSKKNLVHDVYGKITTL